MSAIALATGLILISTPIFAKPSAATPPAIVEARSKLGQSDRAGAIEALLAAIANEKSAAKAGVLKAELNRAATIFITNEGQREFEAAETLRFSGRSQFLPRYEAALKAEGPHFSILEATFWSRVQLKECLKAEEILGQLKSVNPFASELELMEKRLLYCAEKWPELVAAKTIANPELQKYDRVLVGVAQFKMKENDQAKISFERATSEDAAFPGPVYWLWKLNKDEQGPRVEWAQKYVALCKNITSTLRRKYRFEPDLCLEVEAAEEDVKKHEREAEATE